MTIPLKKVFVRFYVFYSCMKDAAGIVFILKCNNNEAMSARTMIINYSINQLMIHLNYLNVED